MNKTANFADKIKYISVFLLLFLSLSINAAGTFRFVLLTDIHINLLSPTSIEDLENSVKQINQTNDIDFILVSGDISDEGDAGALKKAKEILDKLTRPYYIIMGNHETKWSESGVTDFKKIFGYERFRFEHKGYLFLGFNTGPIIRMALGHIAPEDIDWVKKELNENGTNGKPIFLITHYPLLPGDVDNWYDLTDVVRKYPVKAFIGGHYHSNNFFNYDGIPGFISRSNLRDNKPVGGYSEYEITKDSIIAYEHNIGSSCRRWAAISLTKVYYSTQPGSDSIRPNFEVNIKYPKVKEDWIVQSRVGIYSSPAVYKKYLYTGDNLGHLICYTLAHGKKVWQFNCGSRILGTPAAAEGIVVTGSTDNKIYGINAKTGKQIWCVNANAPVLGAVKIMDNIAYIGASDHTFRAIRIKDGTIIWEYNQVKGYIETLPLVTKDKVIFGAWDNTLYALNRDNGKEIWKWAGGHPGMHYSPAAVWPVEANGKVFIADPQRALTAIDINTGNTIWRTLRSMVRETIALSADKKRIYSKTMNDSVVCYSTLPNTPQEVWASNVGFGYEHAPSMPVEKDGVVFGCTKDGLVFALDNITGRVIWKHKIGNTLINTVVPLNKSEILFTNTNGAVGKLKINKTLYSSK